MYERFTDRARKVMQLANQEAQRFDHGQIDTEHLLLGLIIEGSGVAAHVLTNLDVSFIKIREEVKKRIHRGPTPILPGKLPQTSRVKKVVEFAIDESLNLDHGYVGTEHLLLGLLFQRDGIAAQVLTNLGVEFDIAREGVLSLLGPGATERSLHVSSTSDEDLPLDLRATVTTLNAQIDRLRLDMRNAVNAHDSQSAAILAIRLDHLWRTKAAMVRYWISNRPIDHSWLSWNGGAVLKLVQSIHEHHQWGHLPELADALAAAGCTDTEILSHLRQPDRHTSPCWVVDVLLAHR